MDDYFLSILKFEMQKRSLSHYYRTNIIVPLMSFSKSVFLKKTFIEKTKY